MLRLGDILRVQAGERRRANKTAIEYGDVSLTYQELNDLVNRLANALIHLGVVKGDRVAVLGRNCHEYVIVYFALAKIGAIMVPINFWYKASEIAYTLEQSESSVFILDERFRETVWPLPGSPKFPSTQVFWGERHPDQAHHLNDLIDRSTAEEPDVVVDEHDPHIILYTSGTTGFPKGAVHTHRTHYLHALAWALQTRQHEDDVGINVYPLFHTGGPDCIVLPHFIVGGTVIIQDGADPHAILRAAEHHRLTNIFCVPTVWRRLLAVPDLDRYDLSSVRRCLGSSDTLPVDLLDAMLSRFQADVYVTYGLTEAGCILTFSRLTRDDHRKISAVGKPHPLAELRIVRPDGSDAEDGEVGEIIARGPTIMPGYWKMTERTAEAIQNGWLHTGDLGRFDDDGYVYIAGRAKDLIISGGENIYPIEIEKLLREHPGIRDAAVVGVPDREWSESVLAVVVREPDADAAPTEQEVIEFVRSRLAGFKKPRYVEFVEALPVTTSTGKVQKAVLRQIYAPKYAR
jgi:fatty-acyl-CoA synthase